MTITERLIPDRSWELFLRVVPVAPGAARRLVAGGGTGRPAKLHADKGYDYEHLRKRLRARNIVPRIARRGIETLICSRRITR